MLICNKCLAGLRSVLPLNRFHNSNLTEARNNLITIGSPLFPWLPSSVQRCAASSWKRRVAAREERRNTEYQFVTKNTKRTDRIYVWGNAGTGALGVRSFLKPKKNVRPRTTQLTPHRLGFLEANEIKAHKAAAGYGFTVYLGEHRGKDRAFGCGANLESQLGYQEYPIRSGRVLDYIVEPAVIDLPLLSPETTRLVDVACGRAHTWIITDKEGIFSLGSNMYGQCGRHVLEDEVYQGNQNINKVHFDEKIKQISCGQDHTVILTEQGEVYSCGLGIHGQTGQGHLNNVEKLSKVIGDIEGENIVSIATRVDCVLAVSDKGEVFGWGSSRYDQLSAVSGDDSQVNVARRLPYNHVGKVTKAAASTSVCAILNDAGDVFVWGVGILGLGPLVDQCNRPERLPRPLFGRNELNPDSKVMDLQAGVNHLAAVTDSGQLYMWGANKTANLGLAHRMDQYFPFKVQVPAEVRHVECGADHSVVLCKSFA